MFSVYVYTSSVDDGHYIAESVTYEDALELDNVYSLLNFKVVIFPSD
jgi:hypothetical protein